MRGWCNAPRPALTTWLTDDNENCMYGCQCEVTCDCIPGRVLHNNVKMKTVLRRSVATPTPVKINSLNFESIDITFQGQRFWVQSNNRSAVAERPRARCSSH